MLGQSYGDKQREAQRRKKQEELWKKSHPEAVPAAEPETNEDKSAGESKKPTGKDTPHRRSA